MQFRDLKRQYLHLKEDIDKAINNVVENCNFINGYEVEAFENEMANYVGIKNCITCANGTDALTMAMMAWEIGEGDAVFVPDFTFFSSGEIVAGVGATPIFVEVDSSTYNMSSESLEEAIKKVLQDGRLVPRVIIAVDLFGLPADYNNIRQIASKYSLKILEDGAQGFGGSINGKLACGFGDISTTSFFPAKPLGCYGDGGAIFTDDNDMAMILKSIRTHGKGKMKYDNIRIGLNSRLDTLQAAILLTKFKAFKEYELCNINEIARMYTKLINEATNEIKTPFVPENYISSWAQYTVQFDNEKKRDFVQSELKKLKIPSMIYYPKPMHKQTAFKQMESYVEYDKYRTSDLCNRVLSLPIHPYLTKEEVDYIVLQLAKLI